jgi:hypothetical protein
VGAVGAVALAASAVAGCGGRQPADRLPADTARFTWGERRAEIELLECGREGDVVVMAGRTGSMVLQVEADVGEGGERRTGVTADLGGDGIWGAFGPDMPRGPAGEVREVRVEGDRLIVEGTWVTFDGGALVPKTSPQDGLEGRLEARCPDDEDERAAPGDGAVPPPASPA